MYLTDERLKELKEQKSQAEAAAEKKFEEGIFSPEKDKLSNFIEENIVPSLVKEFNSECENAPEKGYFTIPQVRITVTRTTMTWNIDFDTAESQQVIKKPMYQIFHVHAYSKPNVKVLIESACEAVNTRMTQGELDGSEVFTAYIEINLREK